MRKYSGLRTGCWTSFAILAFMLLLTPGLSQAQDVAADVKNQQARAVFSVVDGNFPLLHTSQVFPLNKEGKLAADSVSEQFQQVFKNLVEIAKSQSENRPRPVKLNLYLADESSAEKLREFLAKEASAFQLPTTTWVTGLPAQTPAGVLVSADAIFILPNQTEEQENSKPAVKHVQLENVGVPKGFSAGSILPAGDVMYVAGQLEQRETLAQSTAATIESLLNTLKFYGLGPEHVVQLKAFSTPMNEADAVAEEFRKAFPNGPAPAVTIIEWTPSRTSIEIELIASAATRPLPAEEVIAFLTPDGMNASPVYSRVTQVRRDKLIYIGGIYGSDTSDPEKEVEGVLEELKRLAEQSGSDLKHLAKATYYVSSNGPSAKLNELRPRYYDPKRPPAASKAPVRGVGGLPGKNIVIDMIAVPKAD